MAPAPKATAVLIVNGSYFVPAMWSPFTKLLRSSGFVVAHPQLPTCGDVSPPTKTGEHDVAVVREAAESLIAAGHTVLVVAHSYGGVPASNAVTPDLYYAATETREGRGKGVIGILYIASFTLPRGMTLVNCFERDQGSMIERNIGDDGRVSVTNSPVSFYNDLPEDKAKELVAMEVTHNRASLFLETVAEPWRDLPCTYLLCENDNALFSRLQGNIVNYVHEAGGKLEVVRIYAGHCPFLSMPEETLAVIMKMAGRQ